MEPFTRLAQRVGKDDELPAAARLLFAALDSFLDKRTGRCAPSLDRLAVWLGFCRRHVRRLLLQLEAAGYIKIDRESGKRNSYILLPDADPTGDIQTPPRGDIQTPPRGDIQTPPRGDIQTPGSVDSDRIGIKEQEGKNREVPPPRDLFAQHYREWFASALRDLFAERPELAGLADWFPSTVSEFFLAHAWHRISDPETALFWARRFLSLRATEAEVKAAFEWALGTPAVDARGQSIFSRPDHLDRICFRIQSQRRRPAAPRLEDPAPSPSAAELAWQEAAEADRELVRASLRRSPGLGLEGGPLWEWRCADTYFREYANAR